MSYDVALTLGKKSKVEEVSDFAKKLRDFCSFGTRKYAKITPNLFNSLGR